MTDRSGLRLSVLGALEITRDGAPLQGFVSTKVQALLCYLALTARPHSRDALVGLFWGDMPDADAKTNLRQALANLRRLVAPHVLIDRETVAFDRTSSYWLDAEEFEKMADSRWQMTDLSPTSNPSTTLRTSLQLPTSHLDSAISLYRGDLLEGFHVRDAPAFEEWALTQRERLREQALQILHLLIAHHAARGEYARGIDYAQRLLVLDPWREEAHRQLMLLYARGGQRSAALAQSETCRRVLQEQMGIAPSAETAALYERIKAAGATPRHNLPPQVTRFVGREEELAEITRRLTDPACRLLALVGPGGIGKTRLAVQAAEKLVPAFLHGIFFVQLASIHSTDLIVSTIAAALQFSFYRSVEPKTQLLNYLREKELLLVLDNFEQLIASAGFLSEILQSAPDVKILVTSRERLNLRGETAVSLRGLLFPDDETTQDLAGCSAVELFVTSAQRAEASFTLSDADKPDVIRICRLVEGLPLGIELAATWVRALDCRGIAQEIERTLDFLSTTQPDVPERQRSLRAVFEYSWNRLTESERNVFSKLSVFRGGFRREAAEAVTSDEWRVAREVSPVTRHTPLATLSALVDKSFLRRNPSGRFEVHEVMRQYAEEKLGEGLEKEQAKAAHCRYYADLLQQREQQLISAKQKQTLEEIGAEIENVRAGWQWAVAQDKVAELEQYLRGLERFYDIRGLHREAEETFRNAAAALESRQDRVDESHAERSVVLGKILARRTVFCYRLDRFDQATALAQKGLALLRCTERDTRADIAFCLNMLGASILFGEGDSAKAKPLFEASIALGKEIGDSWEIARSLTNLAMSADNAGEFREAKRLYQESLAIKREIGDRHALAYSLENLALVALHLEEHAEAQQLHQESIAIFKETGDQFMLGAALNNVGFEAYMRGAYSEARQFLEEALTVTREIGYPRLMTYVLANLGNVACETEHAPYSQAHQYFHAALQTTREHGALPAIAFVLVGVAILRAKEGKTESAVELLALAIHHPACNKETRNRAERLMTELTAQLPPDVVAAAQARGKARKLEEVTAEMLRGKQSPVQ